MPTESEKASARRAAREGKAPPPVGSGLRAAFDSEMLVIKMENDGRRLAQGQGDNPIDSAASLALSIFLALAGIGYVLIELFGLLENWRALSPPWSSAAHAYHIALVRPVEIARGWADSAVLRTVAGGGALLLEGGVMVAVAWWLRKVSGRKSYVLLPLVALLPLLVAGAWWAMTTAHERIEAVRDRSALSTINGPLEIYGVRIGESTLAEVEALLAKRNEAILERRASNVTILSTRGMPDDADDIAISYVFNSAATASTIAVKRTRPGDASAVFEARAAEFARRYRQTASTPTYRHYIAPGALIDLSLVEGSIIETFAAAAPQE